MKTRTVSWLLIAALLALGSPGVAQADPGTKYIRDDVNGGDCTTIGTWNAMSKTCTLTTDLAETIQIDANGVTLDGNGHTLTGNSTSYYGVYVFRRSGNTIKNLIIRQFDYGIHLYESGGNIVTDNAVIDNTTSGIVVSYADGNTLARNTVTHNAQQGFHITSSHNNILTGNTVSRHFWTGIYLVLSSGNTVAGNSTSYNGYGIQLLYRSSSNTLADNTVTNNTWGIYVASSSSNNTLTGNLISSNAYGMAINSYGSPPSDGSNGNIVTHNTISNNQGYAIGVDRSSDNQIYNNNIVNNNWYPRQAWVYDGSGNVFHLAAPIGGNYWSDFDTPAEGCTNADGDNFCDAPYAFPGGQDALPWTRQDGWLNQPPLADAGGPYAASEGEVVTLDASGSSDPDDNIALCEWDLDGDGEYDDAAGITAQATYPDNGSFSVGLRVTDAAGESDTDTASVSVNNLPPIIGGLTAPIDPVAVHMPISASAPFGDAGTADTHTAAWDWGDGTTSPGTVTEAGGNGSVAGTHTYSAAGIYTLRLTATDDDGGAASTLFQYVVVYDPEGGFVTGGGWINSPPGAYVADPVLAGRANFGFVSKYQRGASVPSGATEFQFKVANLNFHSEAYDWLVIAGSRAQYKGNGTINAAGDYGFMLTAIDGAINGGSDKFRIKIWDRAAGVLVYDNMLGVDENAEPTTAIGGGSIVIHSGR
jgi:parallel beta-helix repeat protein